MAKHDKIEVGVSTILNPVPVVMVSSAGKDPGTAEGRPNIMTAAWAGTVNSDPPMVSVSVRKERYSHGLIQDSSEFVVNLVDEAMARATDFCGVKSGRDTDKAKETGLRYMPADGMETAPAVQGAPVSLCCKVRRTLELGSHDMFIGEIVSVMVREELLDGNGSLHMEKARLVAYSHGLYHEIGKVMGFVGWSVARDEVLERRMKEYRG